MSFESQTVGDAVVPKFDMHVYTSVLTSDEVKNLVAEYAIPLDLHPCVPPSGLTINRLPVDKIEDQSSSVAVYPLTGRPLARDICSIHVGHHPVFKDGEGTVATSMSQFLKFLMARGVRVENEGVLAAKRKAQATKDKATRKRSAAEGTSRPTKKKKGAPLTFTLDESEGDDSTRNGSRTHHSASPLNTIIPDNVDPTAGGGSLVLEYVRREEDDADRSLDNVEDGTYANSPPTNNSLGPQHSNRFDEDTHVHSSRGGLHHDKREEQTYRHASGSSGHVVSSSSDGSGRLAFPKRNPGGDGVAPCGGNAVSPTLFVPAWNLTTHSILNDAESCRDMMINLATPAVRDQQSRLSDYQALQRSWFELGRGTLAQIILLQRYEALNDDYGELYESHRSCRDVSDRLTETQNQLVDVIRNPNQLADENKTLRQEHLGCASKEAALAEKLAMLEKEKYDLLDKSRAQEDRIKHLKEALASKTSSLSEAESVVGTLKGDLERLTLELSHAEIVRLNYVRHLLPTVFQRLLSSDEYKKSMSNAFNQAIAAGLSDVQ
ncbi:hypothetical protein Tco_1116894 [Tanacetum coccineum]